MKKITVLLFFTSIATWLTAQDEGFSFGFHASPTFSWMANNADGNAIEAKGSNFAFKIGAAGEYYFRTNYALKFGVDMTFNQGGNLTFNAIPDSMSVALFSDSQPGQTFSGTPKANFNYQYLEIPFALKMRTNEIGYMRYYAEIPALILGVKLAARSSVDGSDDFRVSKDTGIMQISWGLGGGVEYSVTETTSIVGGVNFQSGIINTYFGKTGLEAIDKTKSIVNGVAIKIGVLF